MDVEPAHNKAKEETTVDAYQQICVNDISIVGAPPCLGITSALTFAPVGSDPVGTLGGGFS